CLSWLSNANEQFDVIFIDPPTFSNSKRMENTFDVQRDHLALILPTQILILFFSSRSERRSARYRLP
uniref:hypothetical protein n=1 Tax=Serratia sp. ME43 TaxID=2744256 RepID=UPI0015F457A9